MPRKKQKPFIFLLNGGTYDDLTLVSIGATQEEIQAFAKKNKIDKVYAEWVSTADPNKTTLSGNFVYGNKERGWTYLQLKEYEDLWWFWEMLMHELSHLVDQVLISFRRMENETEARAYQLEYYFHTLRKALQKHYGKTNKAKNRTR